MGSPIDGAIEACQKVLPPLDTEAVDSKSLTLLLALVLHEAPKVIVEAGTYQGHFALHAAATCKAYSIQGMVWTADPVDHGVAQRIIDAGLGGRVFYNQMSYSDMLAIVPAPVDFAFIDASEMGGDPHIRLRHLVETLPLMRPGGLIVMDDTKADWTGADIGRRMGIALSGGRGLALIRT